MVSFIGGTSSSSGGTVNIESVAEQFVVGEVGSPTAGETTFTLLYSNIIADSILIALDGVVLPVGRVDRLSYTIAYSVSSSVITFNQGMEDGQLYYIQGIKTVL